MQTQTERNAVPYAPRDTIVYPDTDGEPMAASDLHRDILMWILQALRHHFDENVYVSGDILIYDKQGNPRSSIAPDVLIAFGIGHQRRRTYKVWEEGKPPDFVMELSSENTYENDLTRKMAHYAGMGIRDYFLYDVEGLYLPSPLMGFSLVGGGYTAIAPAGDGKVYSDALGLSFGFRGDRLGIYDPATGKWLQTAAEAATARAEQETLARTQADARAEQETLARIQADARAEAAQAEAAALRAELDRLRRNA